MSFPTYAEFTSTPCRDLGPIPVGWDARKLKFCVSYNDESLPETADPDLEIAYVDISSVDLINGITAIETMTFEKAPSRARRIVRDGDTIISTVRTYLKAISPIKDPLENMIVSTGFAVIRPMEGMDRKYLGYALQGAGFIDQVVANSTGVSYPAINPSTLVCIPVCFPENRDEQKRIGFFLEWKVGQIDALIAKKRELIERLLEKRISVITHAVTKGLDPFAPMGDSGVDWLGQIPKHWIKPALKMRYSVELGKMLDEKRITGGSPLPYLRNTDVQWDSINFDDLPVMDIAEEEYGRYTVMEGDLLVCEGGEVGRSAIFPGQQTILGFQKALHRLRAESEDEIPRFMFYTFCFASATGVFNASGSATIAHLTSEQLRRYPFPQPPINEQKDIVAFLDERIGSINRLIEVSKNAIASLTEYRTSLITAATTGRIDVRQVKLDSEV